MGIDKLTFILSCRQLGRQDILLSVNTTISMRKCDKIFLLISCYIDMLNGKNISVDRIHLDFR